ncbi:MAG: TlyA family RNA methyltransferase [Deltaproteobacteria bacterium]|nr:TlyA family RNA methyltransferase [Deltaproteobacteria bacterium]
MRPVSGKKSRIDSLVFERGLATSMTMAGAIIMAGKVIVNGQMVDKPGTRISLESVVTLKESLPFVGRGGVKLSGALDGFGVDASGAVCMDVGSSTGGFTDCLLQRGAAFVYAIDVGKGLMDAAIASDERVRLLEHRNIRYMERSEVESPVDIAVIDVSFISLEKVLPKVREFVRSGGIVLALIKPQFEVAKGEVGKGGIVKDPEKHRATIEKIRLFSESIGLIAMGSMESPITGAKGNREFWMLLKRL